MYLKKKSFENKLVTLSTSWRFDLDIIASHLENFFKFKTDGHWPCTTCILGPKKSCAEKFILDHPPTQLTQSDAFSAVVSNMQQFKMNSSDEIYKENKLTMKCIFNTFQLSPSPNITHSQCNHHQSTGKTTAKFSPFRFSAMSASICNLLSTISSCTLFS